MSVLYTKLHPRDAVCAARRKYSALRRSRSTSFVRRKHQLLTLLPLREVQRLLTADNPHSLQGLAPPPDAASRVPQCAHKSGLSRQAAGLVWLLLFLLWSGGSFAERSRLHANAPNRRSLDRGMLSMSIVPEQWKLCPLAARSRAEEHAGSSAGRTHAADLRASLERKEDCMVRASSM